jgi:riboflavin synthase
MFTGLVEELGRVRSVDPHEGGEHLVITAAEVLDDAEVGASLAVNGCCLTIVAVDVGAGSLALDAVSETLARTTLGGLSPGDPVNLERPLRLSDRLGGHLVQGHVDRVVTVTDLRPLADGSTETAFSVDPDLVRYIVEKGSVCLDGISLTVAALDPAGFRVAVIPHTRAVTTLGHRAVGDPVNLEVDVLAKYVEHLLERTA